MMNEVKNHVIGPRYGTMGDEVTDTSDNVWLGLVLHYTIGNDVVEQLYQYVDCKSITGESVCEIVSVLESAQLSVSDSLRRKCQYSGYSGLLFPALGLNTERYSLSLRI